jgi:hypothetical protein
MVISGKWSKVACHVLDFIVSVHRDMNGHLNVTANGERFLDGTSILYEAIIVR